MASFDDADPHPLRPASSIRLMLLAALFAALTAVGALIRIPIPPIPFTLQTLFVMLAGGLLGPGGGFMSQCLYLAVGLIGVPVFSGGGGIGYIFTPGFGFLAGFPFAALAVGFLARGAARSKTAPSRQSMFFRYVWIYTAGSFVIYLFGVTFLFFYAENLMGDFFSILWVGFIKFIPTDGVKIVAGAWLTVRLRRQGLYAGAP